MSRQATTRQAWPTLRRAWHELFHEPVDPHVCALLRIGYAALVLINLSVLRLDLDEWFGNGGVLPYANWRAEINPYAWSVLSWLPQETWVLHACWWLAAGQAACLLLGFGSRINAVCVFAWLVSFQARNPLLLDGEDTVFRLVGFFLMFLPLGRAWSLDSLLWRRAPQPASGWPMRMLQIQMAVIYLSAAIVKMQGHTWLNGTAMYYVARLDDYFGRFPTPHFLLDSPAIVAVLTWTVVIAEFSIPVLIWFKDTRLPCLAAAVLFHLACEYSMNLFLFHWIMMVGWMSFLTPDDLAKIGRLLRLTGNGKKTS